MVKDGERIALVECAHLEPRGACLFIIAAEWERAATVGLGGALLYLFGYLFACPRKIAARSLVPEIIGAP
jgi:hypothetical protein